MTPVHPHRRGERYCALMWRVYETGSSPQAWGTRCRQTTYREAPRFIPTGVGNAQGPVSRWRRPAVHPHRRGERFTQVGESYSLDGSSPQAWGTLRIILSRWMCGTVHPHRRGERVFPVARSTPSIGSSPQAWGTPDLLHLKSGEWRFIPTGVGNAQLTAPRTKTRAVHPHRRGERSQEGARNAAAAGSSPQAWGTPVNALLPDDKKRFIPTGVGNAALPQYGHFMTTVHPHRRGERCLATTQISLEGGSSPQAWGTPPCLRCRRARDRFIPTGVGNAKAGKERAERSYGSSPQAWGTRSP